MTIRDRLEAFWSGERPDQIPYTIYYWEWQGAREDPAWETMFRDGLGVTYHASPCRHETRNLEVLYEDYQENGESIHRQIQRTPVGDITQTWANGWHRKYLLETAEDYRVMTYIVKNTRVIAQPDAVKKAEEEVPPYGVVLSAIGRTPLQTILVDYAGLQNFAYHLVDFEEEIRELYEAMLVNFRQCVDIASKAPGRFVSNLENFTAESLGPVRYEEFLLPVYEECFPMLHDAGKIVGSHYDGRTASCKEVIARSPIDLIESLTEPPEGDQTLAECRQVWPDKLFWVNIRVGDYQLPAQELKVKVHGLVEQAAPDGRRLAFEVSEHLPRRWKESMPVVLEALRDRRPCD